MTDTPLRFTISDSAPSGDILVAIDTLDGESIANIRLTPDDAERLIAELAARLNPEVYASLCSPSAS